MAAHDGTQLESDLLNAIEAILDSEGGVQSMHEAAALFKRCTGSDRYDNEYNLQPGRFNPVVDHEATTNGSAEPNYCSCGRLISEHTRRPRAL